MGAVTSASVSPNLAGLAITSRCMPLSAITCNIPCDYGNFGDAFSWLVRSALNRAGAVAYLRAALSSPVA
jgi:hypothetical protein